ncbi:MAG: hypothetical protein ACOYA9_08065 [Bilifractor sp.]|jgi:hypothetical protein
MKTLEQILKNPYSEAHLPLLPSILVILCSIAVNAYVQITSFSSMTLWLLRIFCDTEAGAHLTQILALNSASPAVRAAYGLLMTAFVMIFILPAACWYEEKPTPAKVIERAAAMILIPVILTLTAALTFKVSFIAGVIIALLACVYCMALIAEAGRKGKKNGYLIIIMMTLFLLITAMMLLRNHLVTLSWLLQNLR